MVAYGSICLKYIVWIVCEDYGSVQILVSCNELYASNINLLVFIAPINMRYIGCHCKEYGSHSTCILASLMGVLLNNLLFETGGPLLT